MELRALHPRSHLRTIDFPWRMRGDFVKPRLGPPTSALRNRDSGDISSAKLDILTRYLGYPSVTNVAIKPLTAGNPKMKRSLANKLQSCCVKCFAELRKLV